jgi:hypothetical protein
VGRENAARYFKRTWTAIVVSLDGVWHTFPLTRTFWTTCPEFRGKAIGAWFRRHGLAPWPDGKPPALVLIPIDSNRFRLALA